MAEALTTLKIDLSLKSSAGWETCLDAVRVALTLAYGTKVVPLLYITRSEENTNNYDFNNWEVMAINCTPLNGLAFELDKKMVHLFLMNNILEDSDAYAYILSVSVLLNVHQLGYTPK